MTEQESTDQSSDGDCPTKPPSRAYSQVLIGLVDVGRRLRAERYADRRNRPLGYWASPHDRRLPLAFLNRTLEELIATPVEALLATPGVGTKKLHSLLELLERAVGDESAPPVEETPAPSAEANGGGRPYRGEQFAPSLVSEACWTRWKESVREADLETQPLGRLAPTLRELPTVIWHTPLRTYLPYTLAEIRELKTYGEKRVRVVLEVFFTVHELHCATRRHPHLRLQPIPAFIPPVSAYLGALLAREIEPTFADMRAQLAAPLLRQIGTDAGPRVRSLAEGRVGWEREPLSVRVQADRLGLTRARVYQLLEECGHVMAVRWPEGRARMLKVLKHLAIHPTPADTLRLYTTLFELCFPPPTGQAPSPASAPS